MKETHLCNACPRKCGIDRETAKGYCNAGQKAHIAKVIRSFEYEEPCLGKVDALFFCGCNLGCSYCQNYIISRLPFCKGEYYDGEQLAQLFDTLNNPLDLITPTHFSDTVLSALMQRKTKTPVIWNTSGYESLETLEKIFDYTDIFLCDLKYIDSRLSLRFSGTPDYFETAAQAIKLMRRKKDLYKDGIMQSGLIVRHLVLPDCTADSFKVLDFIKTELGTDTVLSLMSQFVPNGQGAPYAKIKPIEYKSVCAYALKLGLKNGYFQEQESAEGKYTPDFY